MINMGGRFDLVFFMITFSVFQHINARAMDVPDLPDLPDQESPPSDHQVLEAGLEFLNTYQYLNWDPTKDVALPSNEAITSALMDMQRFAGLEETGTFDEPTVEMMKRPRCGMPDIVVRVNSEKDGNRVKRYNVAGVQRYRWFDNDITYKIDNYPTHSLNSLNSALTHDQVDGVIADAFKVWSDVSPLNFIKSNSDDADIHLLFGSLSHTSVYLDPVFDGKGGTLAHAFTPNSGWGDTNGDVHFDDDETFTHLIYSGTNLFYTAAHEIGHALGLDHSDNVNALMWPYDRGYQPNFQMPADDIAGIQAIYGPKPTEMTPAPYCNITLNAAAVIFQKLYVFSETLVWQFTLDGELLTNPDGEEQRLHFEKLPRRIQAVYERWYDGKVVFLKGKNYYVYDGRVAETPKGGIKIKKGLASSLPKSISAAMHNRQEGTTDFLRGKKVYRYDEISRELVKGFPKRLHPDVFPELPNKPTAAFVDNNDHAIVLQGNEYYRYTRTQDGTYLLSADYPQDFAHDYLRCPQRS